MLSLKVVFFSQTKTINVFNIQKNVYLHAKYMYLIIIIIMSLLSIDKIHINSYNYNIIEIITQIGYT